MNGGFDDPRRVRAAELVWSGEQLERAGSQAEAFARYGEAADLEQQANADLPRDRPRQLSLFALTAAELYLRAQRWDDAKRVICSHLVNPEGLTEDTVTELERLLEDALRGEQIAAAVAGRPYQVLEARLEGGVVGQGFAPAQLLGQARTNLVSLTYRIADLDLQRRFRARGQSELMKTLPLFEVPARAASFGLRFVLTTSEPALHDERPARVAKRFLQLAEAAATGPDALVEAVPDETYRLAIATAFRDLAPAPGRMETISFSAGLGMRGAAIRFTSATRESLNRVLEARTLVAAPVRGVLKNVVLEDKHPYIEIVAEDGTLGSYRIEPETHADTIGAKVNRPVEVVHELRRRRAGEDLWALDVRVADGA